MAERGKNAVSVYLDNSYSMGLQHKGVDLLKWGKERTREVINSYTDQDEFQVLTNDLKVEEQRWRSKQDAINYLDNITISSNSLPLQQILEKQDYLFTRSTGDVLRRYLVSDFQESMVEKAVIESDSLMSSYLFQLTADDVRNLYVDSVWMYEPINITGASSSILYRIVNSSGLDAAGVRVTLSINDQVQSIRELNLIANEQRTDTLFFNIYKEGWQLMDISLADYPITMDDAFYFSLPVAGKEKVLEIHGNRTPNVIRRIYDNDNYVELTRNSSDRLNYSSFGEYSLIVLNELNSISSGLSTSLAKYMEDAGNVLLIPPATVDLGSYNSWLSGLGGLSMQASRSGNYKMNPPNLSHVILRDIVDSYPDNTAVPKIKRYYPVTSSNQTVERQLLSLNNNDALLAWFPQEAGNLFYQAVPADESFSNFQQDWLYAPVIYNLALFNGLDQDLYTTTGQHKWITVDHQMDRKDNVVILEGEALEFIPEQRIVNNKLILNSGRNAHVPSGHYKVAMNDNTLAWISYNSNRSESEMVFPTEQELKQQFPAASEITSDMKETLVAGIKLRNEGRPLWRLCLLLSIILLITEVAILKWMPD